MESKIIIVAGWQNIGPEHWQSLWLAKFPNALKVEQKEWFAAQKEDWVKTLDEYIQAQENVLLVGHSLGASTIVNWAVQHPENNKVQGALLVAPPFNYPEEVSNFAPTPLQKLPFPSILVASENDKWLSYEAAENFAKAWGSRLVNAGQAGHLNAAAGYGDWPTGEALLHSLQEIL